MVSHPQPGPSNSTYNSNESSTDPPQTLKLLLIGSSSVGKSSLLLRFTDEVFLSAEEASATIGRYKLSIWDTAGQERFRTLTSSYYRGAQGVVLVYDVTNRESFESLPSWFSELDTFTHSPRDVVRIVVGNKTDKDYSREVSIEEGRAFAADNNALFVETSAKTMRGVEEVFEAVVDKIIDTPSLHNKGLNLRSNNRLATLPGTITLDDDDAEESGWCNC
ncbi:P-loop containing nucleoside triphosphate hydrolase protein [Melampsora americana]|nr:P-loop containing nucleoside triphosphate hydrolase protein [Melampsora americana]